MKIEGLRISETERNRRTLVALYDAWRRGRVRRRPVWLRRGFWHLAWMEVRGITHSTVDGYEFGKSFRDLTK